MNDYIRIEHQPDGVAITAVVLTWYSQRPSAEWPVACRLPLDASESDVAKAIEAVLANRRYFLTCRECGERFPCGMTTSVRYKNRPWRVCHGCATKKFFVVF